MFKLDFIHKKYRTKLDSYGIVSIIIFGKSLPSLLAVGNISDSQFCYSRISISFSFMILLCYLCFWFIVWDQSDYLFGAMFLKSPSRVSPNQIKPLLRYNWYQNNGLYLVETVRFELMTSRMRTERSTNWATPPYWFCCSHDNAYKYNRFLTKNQEDFINFLIENSMRGCIENRFADDMINFKRVK